MLQSNKVTVLDNKYWFAFHLTDSETTAPQTSGANNPTTVPMQFVMENRVPAKVGLRSM